MDNLQSIAENGGLVKSYVAKSSSQKEEVKDVAFEGLQIVAPPLPFAELMDVYEANSILQKCIEFRAQNVVSAGWEIIAEDKENAKEDEKKEIEQFFETCNNEKTFEEIVRDQLIDEYTGGSGAIEVAREGLDGESRVKGKPSKLFNVPIATVRVAKGKQEEGEEGDNFMTGQRFVQVEEASKSIQTWFNRYQPDPDERTEENGYNSDMNGTRRTNEILWFTQPNPKSRHYGLSPIASLLIDVLLAKYARNYNKDQFESGLLARLMLIVEEGHLKKESVAGLQEYINEIVKGGNPNAIPILHLSGKGGKARVEKLSQEIKDMSYLELLAYVDSQIWVKMGVPPMLLGIPNSSFKNTAAEEERKFQEKEMQPERKRLAARYTKMIKMDFGYENWKLQFKSPDLSDQKVEGEIMEKEVKMGVRTLNQWAEQLGFEDIEGGDVNMVWTTMGLIPVSALPAIAGGEFAEEQAEKVSKTALAGLLGYKKMLTDQLKKGEIMNGTDDGVKDSPYELGARSIDHKRE